MCGIAGVVRLDGRPVETDDVVRLTRALAHRGPDGEGTWVDGSVGLGHRRLAILDLTAAGAQPMVCVGGRYVVTYNGELYNFVELRRELVQLGARFTSDSDTEVVAFAHHFWGSDCVLRFNGMWAFAIWDTDKRELFVSRDRFGVKPLHFRHEPGRRFVFASELKAFLHLNGFVARENDDAMRRLLLAGNTAESRPETLIDGVERFPPGHNMIVRAGGTLKWRYWNTLDHVTRPPTSWAGQVDQFRSLFDDACRVRLRSDVPVGTCLSGGVDSSSVVCATAALRGETEAADSVERLARDSHRTFTATYPGTPWDERRWAEQAVEWVDADAHFIEVTAADALQHLDDYTYAFETVGGTLSFPLWATYRAVRADGVAVTLDGQGGDELLAGYTIHAGAAEQDHSLWSDPMRRLALMHTRYRMYGTRIPLVQTARARLGAARRLVRGASAVPSEPANPWIREPASYELDVPDDDIAAIADLCALDRMLYLKFHYELPGLLRNFDRLSMAHGVETRMPLMDWRIVCYAFSLPESAKIGGGYSKRILREAMRGRMPESLRTRTTKVGFTSPIPQWMRGALGDFVDREVDTPEFRDHPLWDGPAIADYVHAHHAARAWTLGECERVWPYVQAHLLRKQFFDAPRRLDVSPATDRREPSPRTPPP